MPCCSSSSDKPVTQTSFYLVVRPRMFWTKGRCDLAATSLYVIRPRSRKFWTTDSSISSGPYWTLFDIGGDSSKMTAMTVVIRCVATTHDVVVESSSTLTTTTLASALHVIRWRHITSPLLLSVTGEQKHVRYQESEHEFISDRRKDVSLSLRPSELRMLSTSSDDAVSLALNSRQVAELDSG